MHHSPADIEWHKNRTVFPSAGVRLTTGIGGASLAVGFTGFELAFVFQIIVEEIHSSAFHIALVPVAIIRVESMDHFMYFFQFKQQFQS